MSELVFEVTQEEGGGYWAKAVGENIFTQGETWEELREMALDAVRCHFNEGTAPASIRLRLVRDEVLVAAA